MGERLGYNRLVHSDWSKNPTKRWTAVALRTGGGWRVDGLNQTPPSDEFRSDLLNPNYNTLAGFDFAIGLPTHYLDRLKTNFTSFISDLRQDSTFFEVADAPEQISINRPFFPRAAKKGYGHQFLLKGHDCVSYKDLLRECEKKTKDRKEAGSIFWTLGSKQVGKGALSGWQQILIPARKQGAQIWPFDGRLASLESNALTIAETYPAEAYKHVGIGFGPKQSKRRQSDRQFVMSQLIARCDDLNISLDERVRQNIRSGFSPKKSDEDPFDALAGLLSMIEVAEGRRSESSETNLDVQRHEGWILGQI